MNVEWVQISFAHLPSLNSSNTKSPWNKGAYLRSSTELSKTANTTQKYGLLPNSSKFSRWNPCLSHQLLCSQNRVCLVLSWSRSDSLKLLTVSLQLDLVVKYIIVTVVRSSRLLLGFCLSPGLSVLWGPYNSGIPDIARSLVAICSSYNSYYKHSSSRSSSRSTSRSICKLTVVLIYSS